MRKFMHTIVLRISELHTKLYSFLGEAPSETKW
jgi:hypothetical protein